MFAKQYTAALVSAAFFSIAAQAATLNWQSTSTLAHPVQSLIPQAQDSGEVAAGQSVHIAVALKVRNKAQLDALTQSILQGGSKHYLSKTEFLNRFSPTEAQAQTVVKHLQASGFRNIKVAPNRLLITADGSAATVKAGFQTSLHRYNINGRQAFANVANAQVPSQLADIAAGGARPAERASIHTALRHPTPQAFKTASVSGHSPPISVHLQREQPAAGQQHHGGHHRRGRPDPDAERSAGLRQRRRYYDGGHLGDQ